MESMSDVNINKVKKNRNKSGRKHENCLQQRFSFQLVVSCNCAFHGIQEIMLTNSQFCCMQILLPMLCCYKGFVPIDIIYAFAGNSYFGHLPCTFHRMILIYDLLYVQELILTPSLLMHWLSSCSVCCKESTIQYVLYVYTSNCRIIYHHRLGYSLSNDSTNYL